MLIADPSAAELCEAAVAVARRVGAAGPLADALLALAGACERAQDWQRAAAIADEALALYREAGDPYGVAGALGEQGFYDMVHGRLERSEQRLSEAVELRRQLGDDRRLVEPLIDNAWLDLARGSGEPARRGFLDCLALARHVGDQFNVAEALAGLSTQAALDGQHMDAARLAGASAAIHERIGAPPWESLSAIHERALAPARSALGADAFAALDAEGRRLSAGQAVARSQPVRARPARAPSSRADRLRQRDVRGMSAGRDGLRIVNHAPTRDCIAHITPHLAQPLAAVVAAFAVAPGAQAADDYFLKIDGVAGETAAGAATDAIEIKCVRVGRREHHHDRLRDRRGRGRQGDVQGAHDREDRRLDQPRCCSRSSAKARRSRAWSWWPGAPAPRAAPIYMRYCIQPVFVVSQTQNGGAGDEAIKETVVFKFGAVSQTYAQNANGQISNVFGSWNTLTNTTSMALPDSANNPCATSRF